MRSTLLFLRLVRAWEAWLTRACRSGQRGAPDGGLCPREQGRGELWEQLRAAAGDQEEVRPGARLPQVVRDHPSRMNMNCAWWTGGPAQGSRRITHHRAEQRKVERRKEKIASIIVIVVVLSKLRSGTYARTQSYMYGIMSMYVCTTPSAMSEHAVRNAIGAMAGMVGM